jgi:hypothetical protein
MVEVPGCYRNRLSNGPRVSGAISSVPFPDLPRQAEACRRADHLRHYILEDDAGLRFERATATATAAFVLEVAVA